MRVLIAPQEFKGTLTAVEASFAIRDALSAAFPGWQCDLLPMADGGYGTTDALLAALGGDKRTTPAHDPLMRQVDATWGLMSDGRGVIEAAEASGLLRLTPAERNPQTVRIASSYGTGELVRAALDAGCRELVFGLGGSATNDGGAGMAQALGYRLLDESGAELPPGGAALAKLNRIDATNVHVDIARTRVVGATDVTNPLCGPTGASAVYGPQKGADAAAIAELDAALANLAVVIKRDLGINVLNVPGAGASGGSGAALIAFLGATLSSGAEVIGEAVHIDARVALADIVITGEGRLDFQTVFGKTPQYVAQHAAAAGKRCICIAGQLGQGWEDARGLFADISALSDGTTPLPTPEEAARQLGEAAIAACRRLTEV
jgi:glycerate 2-kinase